MDWVQHAGASVVEFVINAALVTDCARLIMCVRVAFLASLTAVPKFLDRLPCCNANPVSDKVQLKVPSSEKPSRQLVNLGLYAFQWREAKEHGPTRR